MPQDRFLIAPFVTGLETDVSPWLLPDDAFSVLENVYLFKGKVRKRFGSRLMSFNKAPSIAPLYSRVRFANTATIPAAPAAINIDTTTAAAPMAVGQMLMVEDVMFTIFQVGAGVLTLSTNSNFTCTIDTTVTPNTATITGATTGATVFFYPSVPIMGLKTHEQITRNFEKFITFDTKFAYQYSGGAFSRIGDAEWTGDDADFFWATNYRGEFSNDYLLFVSNFTAADKIKYLDGSTWNDLSPVVNVQNKLKTAQAIVPFKNRLLAFNTKENVEGVNIGTTVAVTGNFNFTPVPGTAAVGQAFLIGTTVFTVIDVAAGPQAMEVTAPATGTASTGTYDSTTNTVNIVGNGQNKTTIVYFFEDGVANIKNYTNRVRWTQNGTPLSGNAWFEAPGKGGFSNAPTKQSIVGVEFLRDRLIVEFEASTFELVYTNNEILPFKWQKINTERGAESTFSIVPFDKVILGVGNVGIHACNGANVERIDTKIEEEVFGISNEDNGPKRVHGVRDFEIEQVYWTFPSITQEDNAGIGLFPYPDKVLVYNYETGSWGINDDSITTFGYYQTDNSETWESTSLSWAEFEGSWNQGSLQKRFKSIVAGNQEGYVFIVGTDVSRNAPALQVTAVNSATSTLTVINHNLKVEDFVTLEYINGVTLDRGDNSERNDIGTTDITSGDFGPYIIADPFDALVGQKFLIGTTVFTITDTSAGSHSLAVTAGSAATGTFNGTTNEIIITGNTENPSTTVYYFNKLATNFMVQSITGTTITITDAQMTGTYIGGGTLARASEINIKTKQFNFYLKEGKNFAVSKVDFHVDKTVAGSITLDYFTSTSSLSLVDDGAATNTLMGTTVLETSPYDLVPLEKTQTRLWHPVYLQAEGEFIQLQLKPAYSEMIDFENQSSDFNLHAMVFHATPTRNRL